MKPFRPRRARCWVALMNAVWLLIGLFAGAGLVLVLLRARLRGLSAEAGGPASSSAS